MNNEDSPKKLADILSSMDKFYVLEEQVPIKVQAQYFKTSRIVKRKLDKQEVMLRKDFLFDEAVKLTVKKRLLAELASVNTVESFRFLENYAQNPMPVLKTWTVLALNEARMLLEGSLSDEKRVFISTGMGGRGDKLRYFCAFFSATDAKSFSDFERDFVIKEFNFSMTRNGAIVEEVVCSNPCFVAFTLLIPVKIDLIDLFYDTFCEMNQLGEIVSNRYILTNVKSMNESEILDFFATKDSNSEIDEVWTA